MRNLLALIGLVVVVGGGVGWYMGWYKFSFARTADGTIQIQTNVDPKKVEADSSTFFRNAATVVGNHMDKAAPTASVPNGAPGATPGPVTPVQGSVTVPAAPSLPLDTVPPPATNVPDSLPRPVPNVPVPIPLPDGTGAPNVPAPGPINLMPPK